MNCYYHQSDSAVGLCKHCSKALCPTCAVDVGGGLACPGCVDEVRELNNLISANRVAAAPKRRWTGYLFPAFCVVLGGFFVLDALLGGNSPKAVRFGATFGSIFLAFGLTLLFVQYSWHRRVGRRP